MSCSFRPVFLLLLASGTLRAHEPAPDAVALEHLVVTAHPYARSTFDLAQSTHVLTGRALTRRQASTVGELLSQQTGISSTWFGPGASRPIIRGLGGDRVRVLQNSLGTADASAASPDHAVALDPLLIERVEVVRGPASLLYGSSAVGGVVNVVTHRIHTAAPERMVEGRGEVRASSVNDELAGGVVIEGGSGPVAWHVDAFRREANDVRIPGSAWSEELHHQEHEHDEAPLPGRIPNTALNSDGAAAGLTWIHSRGHLGFSYSGFNAFYGLPLGGHGGAQDDSSADEDDHDQHHNHEHDAVRIDLRQRRLDLEGEWRLDGAGLRGARFKIGDARYRHQELEGTHPGTQLANRSREARLEVLHEPIGAFVGSMGGSFSDDRFHAEGAEAFLPAYRNRQHAIFLFEEGEFDRLTWQLGARAEWHSARLNEGSPARQSHSGVSTSTGVLVPLNEAWLLTASFSRTERPPSIQERFSDGAHPGTASFELGDPSLATERSTGLEVSLRRRTGRVTGQLNAFAHNFDNFIYAAATGEVTDGLAAYQYQQQAARSWGGEAEVIWHLHEAEGRLFDLTIAADVVRARTRGRENLPRITPPRLRGALDWQRGPLALGVEVQHVLAQEHTAPAETRTPAYTLASAYAGWRHHLGGSVIDVLLRGANLLDEEARMHTSWLKHYAPLPGRDLTLSVRLGF